MLDAKLISDSEFESIKAKIVSGLLGPADPGVEPQLLPQQIGEVAVAQPIQRVRALAQRAEQLDALAERLRHVFRLQGARLIECGRAAMRGREIVEIDQKSSQPCSPVEEGSRVNIGPA